MNLSVFNFQEKSVRTAIRNSDDVWFCLKDVTDILEIQNSRDLVAKQLNAKGVDKIYIPTDGGNQKTTFINEPNLYRVIFRSNKPEAMQFQDWVFEEVLPQIRKTGSYSDKISTEQAGVLSTIVRTRCEGNGKLAPQIWSRLKNHFKYAASYREIKAVDFDEAVAYLESMELKGEVPVQQALPLLPIPFQQGKYIVTVDADGTVKIQDASKYQIVDMESVDVVHNEAVMLSLALHEYSMRLKKFKQNLTVPEHHNGFIEMVKLGHVPNFIE